MANFLIDHEYTLDITPSARPQLVPVSEYDVGRIFTFTLKHNGEEMTIPSSYGAVTVEGTIGSYAFSESASIENGKIVFQLTESMTAHAGKAWTKIKFANADAPVSSCAFILAVDRAGVEAETVIGADGFEQQIVNAVNDWLDEHPPAVGGMSEAFKQALLDCFENVAWINDQGQTYYDALYAALYPPKTLVSISAAFTQGSAVIYDTDSLDTLKQYLTVTATYDDTSTGVVTNYTLSGTLTEGISTITVSYGGKTTTFDVTVSAGLLPSGYTEVTCITAEQHGITGTDDVKQYIDLNLTIDATKKYKVETEIKWASVQPIESWSKSFPIMFASGSWLIGVKTGKYMLQASSYLSNLPRSTDSFDNIVLIGDGNGTSVSSDGSLTVNGTTETFVRSVIYERKAYLFASATSSGTITAACACSMKRTKIYIDDSLYMDLVPCVRNSDSIAGMYDVVGNVFHKSNGSVEFSYTA